MEIPIQEILPKEKRRFTSIHNQPKDREEEKIEIVDETDEEYNTEKDLESYDKASSIPHDMFNIYYPTPYEMVVYLCAFAYDLVLKQITKETTWKVMKEDGTEDM